MSMTKFEIPDIIFYDTDTNELHVRKLVLLINHLVISFKLDGPMEKKLIKFNGTGNTCKICHEEPSMLPSNLDRHKKSNYIYSYYLFYEFINNGRIQLSKSEMKELNRIWNLMNKADNGR